MGRENRCQLECVQFTQKRPWGAMHGSVVSTKACLVLSASVHGWIHLQTRGVSLVVRHLFEQTYKQLWRTKTSCIQKCPYKNQTYLHTHNRPQTHTQPSTNKTAFTHKHPVTHTTVFIRNHLATHKTVFTHNYPHKQVNHLATQKTIFTHNRLHTQQFSNTQSPSQIHPSSNTHKSRHCLQITIFTQWSS